MRGKDIYECKSGKKWATLKIYKWEDYKAYKKFEEQMKKLKHYAQKKNKRLTYVFEYKPCYRIKSCWNQMV